MGRTLCPQKMFELDLNSQTSTTINKLMPHLLHSCACFYMSEKPKMFLDVHGGDLSPRSEDLYGGDASLDKRPKSSKDNTSLGTFTFSMLSDFAHPSEVKAYKNTKFVFKACVPKEHICNPSPSGELHIPGIPIPIVNALTKESLRAIAGALQVKCTYRSSISQMRKDVVAKVPYFCGWSLIFAHKSIKFAKPVKKNPVVTPVAVSMHKQDAEESPADNISFPPRPVSKSLMEKVVNGWVADIGRDMIEEAGCQVCGLLTLRKDLTKFSDLEDKINFDLLDRSHCLDEEMVTRMERKSEDDPVKPLPGPVLDTTCDSICTPCLTSLRKHKMPRMPLLGACGSVKYLKNCLV